MVTLQRLLLRDCNYSDLCLWLKGSILLKSMNQVKVLELGIRILTIVLYNFLYKLL